MDVRNNVSNHVGGSVDRANGHVNQNASDDSSEPLRIHRYLRTKVDKKIMRKADLSLPANEMAALHFHRVLKLPRKEPHFHPRLTFPNR